MLRLPALCARCEVLGKAAARDDADALFALAEHYHWHGPEERLDLALPLYRRAARLAHADAAGTLGYLYDKEGDGYTRRDVRRAVHWYRVGAELGDLGSENSLGVHYHEGRGVRRNDRLAVYWYRRAARPRSRSLDATSALCNLAHCYRKGHGVPRSARRAFALYVQAARRGSRSAKLWFADTSKSAEYWIAECYSKGIGVKKNLRAAFRHFRRLASHWDPDAWLTLGVLLHEGKGVKRDFAEAVRWYRMAAEAGEAWALYNLGQCYRDGEGVPRDLAEARKWMRWAAKWGVKPAATALRRLGRKRGEHAPALRRQRDRRGKGPLMPALCAACEVLREAAATGEAKAVYALANHYDSRVHRRRSDLAVPLFRRAARLGHVEAMSSLAWFYELGEHGRRPDAGAALRWKRAAAECGDSLLQHELGDLYRDGRGVRKNARLSATWYRRAARSGSEEALVDLGHAYRLGRGVRRSPRRAFALYKRAARGRDRYSQRSAGFWVGLCLLEGIGVAKDERAAVHWIERAARHGHAEALGALGRCTFEGRGVRRDLPRALRWYRKAAEENEPQAQYQLARCYREGTGVRRDIETARMWLRWAAKSGVRRAAADLRRLPVTGALPGSTSMR